MTVSAIPSGALSGLKVIDLSAYAPGRYATMLFADMGAEVIGIEVASGARKGEFKTVEDDSHPRWVWHQRNKRSMTLNLKAPEGKEVFRKLIAEADILVEAFRPGAAKRLGIDYETLSRINPGLIYCAITGYGQDGPYAHLINHEPNYQALSGVLERNRFRDGEPHMASGFLGDIAGGSLFSSVAILAAVIHRQKTGEGQFIDVSMMAGLLPLLAYQSYATQMPPEPRLMSTVSPAHNVVPEQAVYPTSDGRHVAISIAEPWLFERACTVLGCPEIIPNHFTDDEDLRRQTFDRLRAVFQSRTMAEWETFNDEHDIGISPVKTLEEVFTDPQMVHRGMIVDYDYPPVGRRKHIGTPFIMSRTPANEIRSIPRFGADTRTILQELGYGDQAIDALFDAGVC